MWAVGLLIILQIKALQIGGTVQYGGHEARLTSVNVSVNIDLYNT